MNVFVDTSAFFAGLCSTDASHLAARAQWLDLRERGDRLVTSSYVLLETLTLTQRRLGIEAARQFQVAFVPLLAQVVWVDEHLHGKAVGALLTANRRDLSLVDCVSFEAMNGLGVATVFAFGPHFAERGFRVLP